MTREQCDLLSAPLVRTMNDMEDEILRVVAAQLAKDGDISDTSKWRIRQLARSGEMDRETAKIIAKYSGLEESFAMSAIEDAATIEVDYVDNAVRAAGLNALVNGGEATAEVSAMNAYGAFQRQAKSTLNLVNTVMMYKAKQTFVNGVNKIYFESEKSRQAALNTMGKYSAGTAMGQFSLQEATRRCIKEMAAKGIPAFVDKRGREWSPEAYVMMDMRSTLGNTARAAQWSRCEQYGIKLIEVSSHMGARPGCAPYQGHIFSLDGSFGITTDGGGRAIAYVPLSDTSYGKPEGLFGINCGHVQYPFMPGVNFQTYFPYPKTENDEMYKNHQKQRYYERQIRAAKRECVMLNETGDTEGFKDAAARLKRSKESYKKFTESKGLYLHNDRTQVVGFDRSVSSKATWANRKAEQAKASAAAVKAGGVPSGSKGSSGGHAVTVTPPRDPVVGNSAKIYRDIDHSHSQKFRPIEFDGQESIVRGSRTVVMNHVTTSSNDIYLSNDSKLKRKAVHKIDRNISEAMNKMGISNPENLPRFYIITPDEMGKNAIASYNPITNIMCIDERLAFKDMLPILQRDGACPNNELSTYVHELFHWFDAQEYIKHHGAITFDNYNDYTNFLNRNGKKVLDKLGINEYNVDEISKYAEKSRSAGEYNETFTEYRVKVKLKE